MPMRSFPLEPTPIHVRDEVLDDLRRRLRATKWPLDVGNDDGYYGVRRSYLAELVAYWADGFDWRAAERAINAYEHYRVDVGGVPVHFMHKPGVRREQVPLILSHGWPWTFWHWSKVIDPLADPAAYGGDPADAFDVIVPSLPGFGFSTPLTNQPDMNFWKIADVWHELMTGVLSYEKYAAGRLRRRRAGHWAARTQVRRRALRDPHRVGARSSPSSPATALGPFSGGRPIPENLPPGIRERIVALEKRCAVHLAAHVLDSATLGYGLADCPAGLLAWIGERWMNWSDNGGDVESVFSQG